MVTDEFLDDNGTLTQEAMKRQYVKLFILVQSLLLIFISSVEIEIRSACKYRYFPHTRLFVFIETFAQCHMAYYRHLIGFILLISNSIRYAIDDIMTCFLFIESK